MKIKVSMEVIEYTKNIYRKEHEIEIPDDVDAKYYLELTNNGQDLRGKLIDETIASPEDTEKEIQEDEVNYSIEEVE